MTGGGDADGTQINNVAPKNRKDKEYSKGETVSRKGCLSYIFYFFLKKKEED